MAKLPSRYPSGQVLRCEHHFHGLADPVLLFPAQNLADAFVPSGDPPPSVYQEHGVVPHLPDKHVRWYPCESEGFQGLWGLHQSDAGQKMLPLPLGLSRSQRASAVTITLPL
ncbi:hypothetical protein ASD88_15800 [Pelomonas sp. Root662]|nr:hypothetical protein ASC81_17280 [Pelomonas sp. Root405]KRA71258.1 hypothetical protein ASD88_15800 [Pelomonas sp. Root662]